MGKFKKEELLTFYKDSYVNEINWKDSLNARLSFPLAIFTLLIGAMSYFLNNIFLLKFNLDFMTVIFWFFFTFLSVSIASSLYHSYKSLFGYEYAYIADLKEIDSSIQEFIKYNAKLTDSSQQINIDDEFTDFLLKQYTESASMNRKNNKLKTIHFVKMLRGLFVSVVLLFITAIPFFFLQSNVAAKIYKVEILNLKEGYAMNDERKKKIDPEEAKKPEWPDIEKLEESKLKKDKNNVKKNNGQE